jgi:hypothetical protein
MPGDRNCLSFDRNRGQLLSAVRFSPYIALRSGTSNTGLSRVDHCLPGHRAGNGEKAIYWTLTVVTSKISVALGGIVGGLPADP